MDSRRDSVWNEKGYNVDVVRRRYLNSREGINFLSLRTFLLSSKWAAEFCDSALRSAIIKASLGGKLSSVGIISNLPVDFRLASEDSSDGGGLVICAPEKVDQRQASSLVTWYLFLPACIVRDATLY